MPLELKEKKHLPVFTDGLCMCMCVRVCVYMHSALSQADYSSA